MIFLNVPYAEKNSAKNLGAVWNPSHKRWYIPEGIDPFPFYRWLSQKDKADVDLLLKDQENNKGISLSFLLAKVHDAVANEFKFPLWIKCELASISHHKSGHIYLELMETDKNGREICKNKAIIWKNDVKNILQKFRNATQEDLKSGLKILLKVQVEFNISFGLSLKIQDIDPEFTLGGIEAKINEIRSVLKKQNIYDKNKKFKPINDFTNIAVISPAGAAGLGDFKSEADLLEFYNLCNFDYYEAIFQGKSTNESISKIFKQLEPELIEKTYDAVVLIRGGGAKTDLHFLNEFDIAKAICECPIPVIVGIGHERDKVILDEIAFKSLDTPSKVAHYITQKIFNTANQTIINMQLIRSHSKNILSNYINTTQQNIKDVLNNAKNLTNENLFKTENYLNQIQQKANEILYYEKQKNNRLLQEIFSFSKNIMEKKKIENTTYINDILNNAKNTTTLSLKTLEGFFKEIEAYNPENVLKKGYAVITKEKKIIKDVNSIKKNDIIEIQIGSTKRKFKISEEL